MNARRTLLSCALWVALPALAQEHAAHAQPVDHSKMDHSKMDHSKMDHSKIDHANMDHSKMGHATTAQTQGATDVPRTPVPALTAEDFAAAFPVLHTGHGHSSQAFSYVLVDRLEAWNREAGSGQAWEVNGWFGGDLNRLRLRSEGERARGRTHSANVELLYSRAITPWWDVVAGARQDFAPGAAQTRAAIGIQGLAPYKFEVSATAYLGGGSGAALRLEGEYTLLLSRRWILQPRVEAGLSANEDASRGEGGGLDKVTVGVRLRYEVSRRFAPYVGWEHERRFGNAAELARNAGERARDSRFVAGLRFWF
ncbi:MAG TPA: copper resistance protein B [Stenotrophomonas sp.]|nr:copper resistance protein B [Stenotrophomonas sp.]